MFVVTHQEKKTPQEEDFFNEKFPTLALALDFISAQKKNDKELFKDIRPQFRSKYIYRVYSLEEVDLKKELTLTSGKKRRTK